MRGETYEEFVEKFKPKKTTDDCYTPPEIYEAVKEWACEEYGIDRKRIVRPFYLGGIIKAITTQKVAWFLTIHHFLYYRKFVNFI